MTSTARANTVTTTGQDATAQWYREYYAARGGEDRNSLLRNPGTLGQHIAAEWAVLRALQHIVVNPATATVLDVGAGAGGSLLPYLLNEFPPEHLTAVDIQPDRIAEGKRRFPSVDFRCADATQLPFPRGHFDVVTESSMFIQLTDEPMAEAVAREMVRVTRSGGWIILADWRYDGGRATMRKLNRARIARLFAVGHDTELREQYPACLIPPVGRFLSAHMPALYFPIAAVFRPLVGLMVTVLEKR